MSRPFSAVAANQHGVPLVYGSDTGIVEHGDNAGDLMELVRIGLTPMAAIAVATVNSAAAIGLEHEIGALQPGMRADLIALDRDPLADITAVREIAIVMRDGRLFDAH
jgi:imidazolonepropionase-like amidohydrolase